MIVNPHKQGKEARRIFTCNKVFGTNATQRMISFTIEILSCFPSFNFTLDKEKLFVGGEEQHWPKCLFCSIHKNR